VNRFIGYSPDGTIINYDTFTLTVIITSRNYNNDTILYRLLQLHHIKYRLHFFLLTSPDFYLDLAGTPDSTKPFSVLLSSRVSSLESYVTTDGKSASLSWNKAPIWGLRPDLYYCRTVAVGVGVGVRVRVTLLLARFNFFFHLP
jgi:hypothetical protein